MQFIAYVTGTITRRYVLAAEDEDQARDMAEDDFRDECGIASGLLDDLEVEIEFDESDVEERFAHLFDDIGD